MKIYLHHLVVIIITVGLSLGTAKAQTVADNPAADATAGASPATSLPPEKQKQPAKDTAKKAQKNAGAGKLSSADRRFMMNAAKDGMMEVHMGQMGQQQGQSKEVKKLGKMIENDHTKANKELVALAEKKGVKLDTKHKMPKLDKANFDKAWLAQMVEDHQTDIAAFQKAGKTVTDPEVKKFIAKTLPVLQKHLKAVQSAQSKMGNTKKVDKKSG